MMINTVEVQANSPQSGTDMLNAAHYDSSLAIKPEEGVDPSTSARLSSHIPLTRPEKGRAATVIIERRLLIRDCLVKCLSDGKKSNIIKSFATVEEWLKERPQVALSPVILLCSADRSEAEIEQDIDRLIQNTPGVPIIILSDREDAGSVLNALDKGVRGYIPVTTAFEVAVQAIRLVRAGGTFVPAVTLISSRDSIEKAPPPVESSRKNLFTPRQSTVVEALLQGKSNKIIAYELNMCESTVKVHVRNIMKKLRARNRTEVVCLMNDIDSKGNFGRLGSEAEANV